MTDKQNLKRYAQVRALLATAGARFITIDFTKKDGTPRSLTYNAKAAASRTVGDAASESAKQAVETRASNNPNLINVWDHAKQGFRSINMDTITRIKIDGTEYTIS